jgi:hypothetical protein
MQQQINVLSRVDKNQKTGILIMFREKVQQFDYFLSKLRSDKTLSSQRLGTWFWSNINQGHVKL